MKMSNKIYTVLMAAAAAFALTSCEWTEPESKDFTRTPVSEQDPQAYEQYLRGVRAYKDSDHKVTILSMQGTTGFPVSQSQRLMAMPDSADFICVWNPEGLHQEIVAEIEKVRRLKGTETVSHVDFSLAEADWLDYANSKSDKGEPAPTLQERKDFFKAHAQKQLENCAEYGFSGIMFSYTSSPFNPDEIAAKDAFVNVVLSWKMAHLDSRVIIRGNIPHLSQYKQLLSMSDYLVLVLGGQQGSASYINHISANLSQTDFKQKTVLEVSVPLPGSSDQTGDTAEQAAVNILSDDIVEFEPYKVLGLAVSNASDDYFNENYYTIEDKNREYPVHLGSYANIRRAIGVFGSK